MTDTDYADDLALLAYTSDQAEFLLCSFLPAAGSIGISVNADKRVHMFLRRMRLDLSAGTAEYADCITAEG